MTQPIPQTTPPPVLDALSEVYHVGTTWFINMLGAHPWLIPLAAFLVCVNNLAHLVERRSVKAGREIPQWAVAVVGLTDPLVANFWRLVDWVADKFGVPVHGPVYDDDPKGGSA